MTRLSHDKLAMAMFCLNFLSHELALYQSRRIHEVLLIMDRSDESRRLCLSCPAKVVS